MTTHERVIEVRDLTVRYGRTTAVEELTLEVRRGTVYALLGRNGAGKSSLLRCLLGVQRPARGFATLLGRNSWQNRAELMHRVSVVPEEPDAPPEMTPAQIIDFFSRLYQRWNSDAAMSRLDKLDIPLAQSFGRLSKGQKRQVLLATALASDPELLVLDDPTLGLDVVARKELFEQLIEDLAGRGTTVLITTHDLSGIEAIADRVGVMTHGRLTLDEDLEILKQRFRRIRFPLAPAQDPDFSKLQTVGYRRWGNGVEAIVANYDDLSMERFRANARVSDVEVTSMSLEEIFIAIDDAQSGRSS